MGLPQINIEDMNVFEQSIEALIEQSCAKIAMIADKSGYLVYEKGENPGWDTVTIATLAANAYNATSAIVSLVNEPPCESIYQQGERYNTVTFNIDENVVLIVIFDTAGSIGAVKHFAKPSLELLAWQLSRAAERPQEDIQMADSGFAGFSS